MAARVLAATKAASRALKTTAPRPPSLLALGSSMQPNVSSLPGRYLRPVLRRPFSSEDRLSHQMDQLRNEVNELKLAVQNNSEKQNFFEATIRCEIHRAEHANLMTTLTLIGLLCGFASVMMCLYQVAPPYNCVEAPEAGTESS